MAQAAPRKGSRFDIKLQERMCKGEFFLEQSPYNTIEDLWDGEV